MRVYPPDRFFLALLQGATLLVGGCALISDQDLAARLDLDADDVSRPTDCDDDDAAVGGPIAYHADADSDGYGGGSPTLACLAPEGFVTDGSDCDDTDPAVHPMATEACDFIDNNCDTVADEDSAVDAPTWFTDEDADSYGNPDASLVTCYQPAGYVLDASDCDDADTAINPEAIEVCDGADVDEDCSGAPDLDCDDDGHDADTLGGDDCNDADLTIHPGVREVCGDTIDDNCDGEIAGSCTFSGSYSLADAPVQIDGVVGRSAAGWSVTAADLTGDGNDDAVLGGYRGVSLVAGPVTEDTTLATATTYVTDDVGRTNNLVATSDVDGDGLQDLLVSSPASNGFVGIFYGPVSTGSLMLSAADASFSGSSVELLGRDLAAGADLDDDGYDDAAVVVTAYPASDQVDVVLGGGRGLADIGNRIAVGGQSAGVAMGGDIDGDGVSDLVIGCSASYSLWVMLNATEQTSTGDADGSIYSYDGYWVANGLAIADDVNGDGYGDVIECSSHSLSSGATPVVHVLQGPIIGTQNFSIAAASFTLADQDQLCEVSAKGDLDGDGLQDIVVGSPSAGNVGIAYVLLSPLSGALDASAADATLTGEETNGQAAYAVRSGGDLNADGFDDALIGDPCTPATASCPSTDLGRVYLLFGG